MTAATGERDWDPGSYGRFRGLRLRPALDLLAQVGEAPPGDVVDLGCGNGAVAGPLRARFPGRRLVGLDASEAMLAQARGYDATALADIAEWVPEAPPALLFSNAALHWLPEHGTLLPRLAALLAPGGTLAVQMPRQHMNPSHRLAREIAEGMGLPPRPPQVDEPAAYHRLLSAFGEVSVWETEYLQRLDPVAEGHPVRAFTESTLLRPYREALPDWPAFLAAYDAALAEAYPAAVDGSVLFPFRRLFLTLRLG